MFGIIATHINKDKYKIACFRLRKFYFMRSLRRYKYYKHDGKSLGIFLKDLLDYFVRVWKWDTYEIKSHLKHDNIILLSRPQFIHFREDTLLDVKSYEELDGLPYHIYGMYCIERRKKSMTVKELKEKLKDFDDDLEVYSTYNWDRVDKVRKVELEYKHPNSKKDKKPFVKLGDE